MDISYAYQVTPTGTKPKVWKHWEDLIELNTLAFLSNACY